jgi:hypothetical protein
MEVSMNSILKLLLFSALAWTLNCQAETNCDFTKAGADIYGGDYVDLAHFDINKGQLTLTNKPVISDSLAHRQILLSLQKRDADFQELFKRLSTLLPDSYLKLMTYFRIATDGKDGTQAFIKEIEPGQWQFTFDIQDMLDEHCRLDFDNVDYTIIHELGHMLAETADQFKWRNPIKDVNYLAQEKKCHPNLLLEEGCFHEDAYYNRFFQKFWFNAPFYQDWRSAVFGSTEIDYAAIDRLYNEYHTHFISNFSAVYVIEDFAEVFTHFVLDIPHSSEHIKEKLHFVASQEALIRLKREIKHNL